MFVMTTEQIAKHEEHKKAACEKLSRLAAEIQQEKKAAAMDEIRRDDEALRSLRPMKEAGLSKLFSMSNEQRSTVFEKESHYIAMGVNPTVIEMHEHLVIPKDRNNVSGMPSRIIGTVSTSATH